MNIEEMLDEIEIGGKLYKKTEVKERLKQELEDKKARGWNDTTITLEDLEILLDDKKCLHCDKGEAIYCEECFQKLIAENLKLQRK